MFESLFLPLIALGLHASPSTPAPPRGDMEAQRSGQAPISEENRAALRCSAAFALVGARQAQGEGTKQWPEIQERGREFFVVALAGIMDEHKLDRAAIEREVRAEAQRLNQTGEVDKIMPACLLMLQAAGL